MATRTFIIDGNHIRDIASFYGEINRVFMADETWTLAQSLDALDDMFYGAYGAARGNDPILVIWRNMDKSRLDLGRQATRDYYLAKLKRPEMFNVEKVRRDLDALDKGTGATYFDIVIEIFAAHPRFTVLDEIPSIAPGARVP